MNQQRVQERFKPYMPLLCCPLCLGGLTLSGGSAVCDAKHSYDLSAKGYINFAPWQNQRDFAYNKALFECRRRVFADGFYSPVLDAIMPLLLGAGTVLDVGCGEGWYSGEMSRNLPDARILGVDLSRDAIALAAGQSGAAFVVGDLKRLPVMDHTMDAVVDVLTPSDYAEFSRVLKPQGRFIKVIPQADYLTEIRQLVKDRLQNAEYSNQRVLEHLQKHARVKEQIAVRKEYSITREQAECFLRMTPMTMGLDDDTLRALPPPRSITIDMQILCCTFA